MRMGISRRGCSVDLCRSCAARLPLSGRRRGGRSPRRLRSGGNRRYRFAAPVRVIFCSTRSDEDIEVVFETRAGGSRLEAAFEAERLILSPVKVDLQRVDAATGVGDLPFDGLEDFADGGRVHLEFHALAQPRIFSGNGAGFSRDENIAAAAERSGGVAIAVSGDILKIIPAVDRLAHAAEPLAPHRFEKRTRKGAASEA